MSAPLKPIIFCDFDGVLCHDRFWRSLPAPGQARVQQHLFSNNIAMVDEWMRGRYSAEEINRHVAEATGIPYEMLWAVFVRDCETMSVSTYALEKLHRLRTRCTVMLLTGNMDCFTRFTRPSAKLDEYFDHISNSYEEGVLKTDDDGRIFLQFAEKYGVPIQSCYVLDDSARVTSVFSRLGGTACLVTQEQDVLWHLEWIGEQTAQA